MPHTNKKLNTKGEGSIYYIGIGILLTVGIFYSIKYFHDRDNDVTIHLPKVEVH